MVAVEITDPAVNRWQREGGEADPAAPAAAKRAAR